MCGQNAAGDESAYASVAAELGLQAARRAEVMALEGSDELHFEELYVRLIESTTGEQRK